MAEGVRKLAGKKAGAPACQRREGHISRSTSSPGQGGLKGYISYKVYAICIEYIYICHNFIL